MDRIIIGGFGQGAVLAFWSALTFGQKIGAIIALSCWFPIDLENSPVRISLNFKNCYF